MAERGIRKDRCVSRMPHKLLVRRVTDESMMWRFRYAAFDGARARYRGAYRALPKLAWWARPAGYRRNIALAHTHA